MQPLLGPLLNVRDTVIAARKDAAHPTGNDFYGRKLAHPVGVLWKMFIKEPDDPKLSIK
jgi:hypothetical protein